MEANAGERCFERPQASDSSSHFGSHDNFWKDTYGDIAKLGCHGNSHHGSGADSSCPDSLDCGSASSLYGSDGQLDGQLGRDMLSFSTSLQSGDLRGALSSVGDLLRDIEAGLPGATTSNETLPVQGADTASTAPSDGGIAQPVVDTGAGTQTTSSASDVTPTGMTAAQLAAGSDVSNDTVLPGLVPTDSSYWGIGATGPFKAGEGTNNHDIPTTEVNGWFIAFPEKGSAPINANDQIQVKGMDEWILSNSGEWREVPNQATDGLWSGAYPAKFDAASGPDTQVNNADGSVSLSGIDGASNPVDNIYHGGIKGGDYNPATDQGVYVTLDARVNYSAGSDTSYVMQVGNDFGGANDQGGITNTGLLGNNNWTRLTDQYQQIAYTSLSADVLENNPPPGITA